MQQWIIINRDFARFGSLWILVLRTAAVPLGWLLKSDAVTFVARCLGVWIPGSLDSYFDFD